jgi:imidazolonepropionase-like amidohydrolase
MTRSLLRRWAAATTSSSSLRRAGVSFLAGTDAPAPGLAHGLSLHHELELLVLSGLTPLEALASATSEPARAFGFHDRGALRRACALMMV